MTKTLVAVLAASFGLAVPPALAKVGYVGIGLSVGQLHGVVTLSEIRPDGPAAKAGITEGLILHEVDHQSVAGKMNDEIGAQIRGDGTEGSVVVLGVQDPTTLQSRDVSVTREYLEIPCLAEGKVMLHITGNLEQGYFTGGVGGHAIYWPISHGKASGLLNVMNVEFDLKQVDKHQILVSGTVGETSIQWLGKDGDWDLEQACIH